MAVRAANLPTTADLRPWVAPMVRLGYIAKGVIYLLIGVFAFRLAMGAGGRITNATGVLRAFAQQPFGSILLTVVGISILAYAAWQVAEAVFDTRRKGGGTRGWFHRSLTIIKGVVYGTIGWEALQLVFARRVESPGADEYAREAMQVPLGRWFLVLVGIGVAWYGLSQIWMAWKARFDDDLDQQRLRGEGLSWVFAIGRAGIGARGIILAVMGIALLRAGFDRSPSKAGGIAESLWTLFAQPYGHWLLAATAAGLVCFGWFQLMHARYARLD